MYMNNLRFADDVALIASNKEDLIKMMSELKALGGKAGLSINIKKWQNFVIRKEQNN